MLVLAATVPAATTSMADDALGGWLPIPDSVWSQMQGRSWHANLPCPAREKLALLQIPYIDFNGKRDIGDMVIARSAVEPVLAAFAQIYRSGFRINNMQLVSAYDGDDNRSMAANNTSAFNCRLTSSGKRLSQHSYGLAIDINPVQNPYVRKGSVQPAAGAAFDSPKERVHPRPGLITKNGPVTKVFTAIGWHWGGAWRYSKDYQHFSQSGH